MKPIIRVENLSKKYTLGAKAEPYGTLRESLVRAARKPLDMIGGGRRGEDNTFWALKDIDFDVMPGEVVGIIGRNGAGKSTLLKVLSRITEPTTGRIELFGRVGSLLEVGTGFHPELTGRENVYLNGAILGMRREEISKKFDEIVDFAEIEDFLDTPVKRYSSGMYVRLAFAVAANLDPEILIIDEVLAVGDAKFQKKCLGKMTEVANAGRTVLFVSHNMAAVRELCERGIIMRAGKIIFDGDAGSAADNYLDAGNVLNVSREWTEAEMPGNDNVRVRSVAMCAGGKTDGEPILTGDDIAFEVEFYNALGKEIIDVTWDLKNSQGIHVAHIGRVCDPAGLAEGWYRSTTVLGKNILNAGRYTFDLQFGRNQQEVLYREDEILAFDLEDAIQDRGSNFGKFPGVIHPVCGWKIEAINTRVV